MPSSHKFSNYINTQNIALSRPIDSFRVCHMPNYNNWAQSAWFHQIWHIPTSTTVSYWQSRTSKLHSVTFNYHNYIHYLLHDLLHVIVCAACFTLAQARTSKLHPVLHLTIICTIYCMISFACHCLCSRFTLAQWPITNFSSTTLTVAFARHQTATVE